MPEEINGVRSPESASLEDDAQAQNKKISSGIYKDAGEMMCDILGKEEYCEVMLFFFQFVKFCMERERRNQDANKKSAYFVVFMTRRCHVLKMIFFSTLLCDTFQEQLRKDWFDLNETGLTKEDFKKENIQNVLLPFCKQHFITDFNLLSTDYAFAQYYGENGFMPDFMIADEVLLHGRTMNHLLGEMEQRLMDAFEVLKKQAKTTENSDWKEELTKEDIRDAFQKNIKLSIYAQKSDTLLLYSRYAEDGKLTSNKRDEELWRKLSLEFAQIVSSSNVNNVAFSWSFTPTVAELMGVEDWKLAVPEERGRLQLIYRKVQTKMQGISMRDHVVLITAENRLQAVWSLRVKKSLTGMGDEQRWMIVPYFMMGEVESKKIWQLFARLREDIRESLKQQKEITSPELKALDALLNITVAEDEETHPQDGTLNLNQFRYDRICGITNLLLNCIFIKKYLGEEHLAGLVDSIEWDHLYSNFSRFDPRNGTLQDVTPALKLLWKLKLGAPEEYLEFLLENTEGMELDGFSLEQPTEQMTETDGRIENEVLDVIDQMGVTAEKNAHENVTSIAPVSEKDLASWGGCHSLLEILQKLRDREDAGREKNLFAILGELIQAMDLGIISMSTYEFLRAETPGVYTMVKAGEQALFIKPIRYRNFISLFNELETKHYPDRDAIMREVRSFVRADIEFIKQNDPALYEKFDGTETERANGLFERLWAFLDDLYDSGQKVSYWRMIPSALIRKESSEGQKPDAWLQDAYIRQYHQMYGYV